MSWRGARGRGRGNGGGHGHGRGRQDVGLTATHAAGSSTEPSTAAFEGLGHNDFSAEMRHAAMQSVPPQIIEGLTPGADPLRDHTALKRPLENMQGASYPRYKDLEGTTWHLKQSQNRLLLKFAHVQADPYAKPSNIEIYFDPASSGWVPTLWENRIRCAVSDRLCHQPSSLNATFADG